MPLFPKLVGHTRVIRYTKGKKKGKVKRVKSWRTRETRAATTGVSGPSGTYKNTPSLGQEGAIAGDSDTAVLSAPRRPKYADIVFDAADLTADDRLTVEARGG